MGLTLSAAPPASSPSPNSLMRGPSWPEERAMQNMERACWNWGDWTVPDRSARLVSFPSSPAGRNSFTLSRNSWFCRRGCRVSPVRAVERSTAPPPAPAPGTCMLERMDWRSDSWMAGPAPPGAGAGTGTVAGVEEEGVELLLVVVVVVVEVDDV